MTRSISHRLRAAAIVLTAAGALTGLGSLAASADEHVAGTASVRSAGVGKYVDIAQDEHLGSTDV
ncbi:hypothetical protein ACQEVS_14545 [Streptomyces sp. CA-181903]|uniref:hypothetical protein n=1 Tax=Streptomyces sp. CA-181903 TaxID=3240055 RepID=UPI003D8BEAA6